MNKEVRDYMRRIGRKGGKRGKGSPAKQKSAVKAAQARWRKRHPIPENIVLT